MRKFIIKSLIFISIFTLLNQLVYNFFTYKYIYEDYDTQAAQLLEIKPENIILGDSHPYVLKQEYLDESIFNFSYNGDSVHEWLFKLKFCLKNKIPLKKLYIQFDPHILSDYRMEKNRKKLSIHTVPYSEFQKTYKLSIWEYTKIGFLARYFPLTDADNSDLFVKKIGNGMASMANTSVKTPWKDLSQVKRDEASILRVNQQLDNIINKRVAKSFIDLINLCNENQIELIGIQYPVSPEYREHRKEKDLLLFNSFIANFNIDNIDFSSEYNSEFCFVNTDHLNDSTAQEFAKIFLTKINTYE